MVVSDTFSRPYDYDSMTLHRIKNFSRDLLSADETETFSVAVSKSFKIGPYFNEHKNMRIITERQSFTSEGKKLLQSFSFNLYSINLSISKNNKKVFSYKIISAFISAFVIFAHRKMDWKANKKSWFVKKERKKTALTAYKILCCTNNKVFASSFNLFNDFLIISFLSLIYSWRRFFSVIIIHQIDNFTKIFFL